MRTLVFCVWLVPLAIVGWIWMFAADLVEPERVPRDEEDCWI